MRLAFLGLVAALSLGLPAAAQMKVVSEGKAPVQLQSDEIVLHSDTIGREFVIEVTKPVGAVQAGRRYPVVYALDGGFGVAGGMARMMTGGDRMAPAYIVSIGYSNPEGRHIGPRNTDLLHATYTQQGRSFGGGGAAFERFIIDDVKPMIEQRYAADPGQSILMGHSGGALFAATILVNRPDEFAGYVIGSLPIKGWDEAIADKARAVASKGRGKRVYLGLAKVDVGALGSEAFGPALSGQGSTFKVQQDIYDEESHSSAYLMLVARGLPYVLPLPNAVRASISLPAPTIDRYIGFYRAADGRTLEVKRDGGRLLGALNGSAGVEIAAETEMKFFAKTVAAELEFAVGAPSPLLTLTMNGAKTTFQRQAKS